MRGGKGEWDMGGQEVQEGGDIRTLRVENRLVPNRKRSKSRLYIVILLI